MNNDAIAEETWDEMEKRLFTPEERAICNSRVAISLEVHDAMRSVWAKRNWLSLAASRSQVSRMETDDVDPKLGTVLKVLGALGKTLAIVPIEEALGELPAEPASRAHSFAVSEASSIQLSAADLGREQGELVRTIVPSGESLEAEEHSELLAEN